MRQWKVGTITLGVTLICIGLTFALGNLYDFKLVGKILKWWPLILIAFGIEILAFTVQSQNNPAIFKFNGTSIFITLVILMICGGLFVVSNIISFNNHESNIFERIDKEHKIIQSQQYKVNTDHNNYAIEKVK